MKKIQILTSLIVIMICLTACPDPKSEPSLAAGALSGEFSVSETTKVHFSKGNLQYQASTATWRFAENQWDVIGDANKNITNKSYSGWLDLFGFATASHPMTCKADNAYYGHNTQEDLSEERYREDDWGWHNKISNGGNREHLWRTLTRDEFVYLMQERPHANDWTFAKINGVLGIILVPDDWECPSEVTYTPRTNTSNYSISDWRVLERTGAVFLPAAGRRNIEDGDFTDKDVTKIEYVGEAGLYWTATSATWTYNWRGIAFIFDNTQWDISNFNSDAHSYMYGYSVRLVQDIK